MADKFSRQARSAIMRGSKSKDTRPELTVRRLLHRGGFRYRLHRPDLPGKPDLVFPSRRKVIFVNGCFWHQHPSENCPIVQVPRSNVDYWAPKFARTLERDAENMHALQDQGWDVLVVWECETSDHTGLKRTLMDFLN